MNRGVFVIVLAFILVLQVAGPALADRLRFNDETGEISKEVSNPGTSDEHDEPDTQPVSTEPVSPTTLVRVLQSDGNGGYCDVLSPRDIGENETEHEIQQRAQIAWTIAYDDIDPASYTGLCEGQDEVELDSDDILAIVRDQLPRPEPSIEPGYGLTGMPAYLETNRPLDYDETLSQTIQGLTLGIEVRATGGYEVDWGDGTVTGPHDTAGQPHPRGGITHVYGDAGTYDVAVTDTWQLEWRYLDSPWFPAFEATLDPVVLEDFTVRQAQSVRTTAG